MKLKTFLLLVSVTAVAGQKTAAPVPTLISAAPDLDFLNDPSLDLDDLNDLITDTTSTLENMVKMMDAVSKLSEDDLKIISSVDFTGMSNAEILQGAKDTFGEDSDMVKFLTTLDDEDMPLAKMLADIGTKDSKPKTTDSNSTTDTALVLENTKKLKDAISELSKDDLKTILSVDFTGMSNKEFMAGAKDMFGEDSDMFDLLLDLDELKMPFAKMLGEIQTALKDSPTSSTTVVETPKAKNTTSTASTSYSYSSSYDYMMSYSYNSYSYVPSYSYASSYSYSYSYDYDSYSYGYDSYSYDYDSYSYSSYSYPSSYSYKPVTNTTTNNSTK